jgi:hypothetical protein
MIKNSPKIALLRKVGYKQGMHEIGYDAPSEPPFTGKLIAKVPASRSRAFRMGSHDPNTALLPSSITAIVMTISG